MYYFHPAIKNYLQHKVVGVENKQALEEEYDNQFSLYYFKLLEETYNAIGTKDHVLSFERFNVILSQGKENDFKRAIGSAKYRSVAGGISTYSALIFLTVGMYGNSIKFLNKALAIHEELQDKVGMAKDYRNISLALANIKDHKAESFESFSKGLEILQELEEQTAYYHPLSEEIQGYISQLQEQK